MPRKAVANGVALDTGAAVADIEVEGDQAVATILVVLDKGGSLGTDMIGGAMPSELVADILSFDAGVAVVDGKI